MALPTLLVNIHSAGLDSTAIADGSPTGCRGMRRLVLNIGLGQVFRQRPRQKRNSLSNGVNGMNGHWNVA